MSTDQVLLTIDSLFNLFVCSVAEDLSNLIQEQLKVLIPLGYKTSKRKKEK